MARANAVTKVAKSRVAAPDAADFLDVRGLLDDEERQIQDTVARWVDERVLPIIGQAFDDHRFPSELIPELAEMGLLGCNLDGYECAGLNNVMHGVWQAVTEIRKSVSR